MIDAKYDYDKQIYKDSSGKEVDGENWDFPCPRCKGPAELFSVDAYFEYHRCLSCKNEFKVS